MQDVLQSELGEIGEKFRELFAFKMRWRTKLHSVSVRPKIDPLAKFAIVGTVACICSFIVAAALRSIPGARQVL